MTSDRITTRVLLLGGTQEARELATISRHPLPVDASRSAVLDGVSYLWCPDHPFNSDGWVAVSRLLDEAKRGRVATRRANGCADCGKLVDHYAKGRCKKCYHRGYWKSYYQRHRDRELRRAEKHRKTG